LQAVVTLYAQYTLSNLTLHATKPRAEALWEPVRE